MAWVQVPTFNTTSTILYMYYGNQAASSQQAATSTWESNYDGVWHLEEGSGTSAADSTSRANTLTLSSASWDAAAQIGTGWNGTGSNNMSRADDADFDFTGSENFSIDMWFKSDGTSNPSDYEVLADKHNDPRTGAAGYSLYAYTSGEICFRTEDSSTADTACTSTDYYDATWHHVMAVKTGTSRIDLYIDGVLKASDTSIGGTGSLANSFSLFFGGMASTYRFRGNIDQIAITRTNHDVNWALQEYNNQNSPSTFYTLSSVESQIYAPTMDEVMRHGKFFCPASSCGTSGVRPFAF